MTDLTKPNPIGDLQQPLAELRTEINRIDSDMLTLIARRMQVVRQIAEQKIQHGLVFRARREIEKIRMLETYAEKMHLPSAMTFDLWRIIMSRASMQQRPFRLICLGAPHLSEVALAHFSRDVPIVQTDDLNWVIEQQRHAPTEVMCLCDKQRCDWWSVVAENTKQLSVVAELPWRTDDTPTGYLLAHCPVDLEQDAEILCTLQAPDSQWADIAAKLTLPVLSKRYGPSLDRWLIKFHDSQAHSSIAAMQDSICQPLPANWSLGWLGRFPRFHRQQTEA